MKYIINIILGERTNYSCEPHKVTPDPTYFITCLECRVFLGNESSEKVDSKVTGR